MPATVMPAWSPLEGWLVVVVGTPGVGGGGSRAGATTPQLPRDGRRRGSVLAGGSPAAGGGRRTSIRRRHDGGQPKTTRDGNKRPAGIGLSLQHNRAAASNACIVVSRALFIRQRLTARLPRCTPSAAAARPSKADRDRQGSARSTGGRGPPSTRERASKFWPTGSHQLRSRRSDATGDRTFCVIPPAPLAPAQNR